MAPPEYLNSLRASFGMVSYQMEIPADWKTSCKPPLLKPGKKIKLFTSVINLRLVPIIDSLFSDNQAGSRRIYYTTCPPLQLNLTAVYQAAERKPVQGPTRLYQTSPNALLGDLLPGALPWRYPDSPLPSCSTSSG